MIRNGNQTHLQEMCKLELVLQVPVYAIERINGDLFTRKIGACGDEEKRKIRSLLVGKQLCSHYP